jgi:phosphoserine phosphatase
MPSGLAPREACDIAFAEIVPDQADAAARRVLAEDFPAAAFDLVVQEAAGRRKCLLVADMESTIIENEMLDDLADFIGARAKVAEITRQAMNGEIDFAAALRARVALLCDLPATVLEEAAGRIRIMAGAPILVATMRAGGAYCALVSGGFGYFTSQIRERLGFDVDVANELLVADGKLTGAVREPILRREEKLATLTRLAAERGLPLAAALAVGDGANDLPMIQAAGLGIAFHAKPAVAAQARLRIDHADLTALLFAQGYRRQDFVAG